MRSIIDEIAKAETAAEQIRQLATVASREKTAKARADAQTRLTEIENAERQQTREALIKAETDGNTMAAELLHQMTQQADDVCKAATEKIPDAVDYLVKKVLQNA